MPRHLLIDGYNLLFAAGKTPNQANRTYLLNLLAAYKSRKHLDVTVVFDRKSGDPSEGKQVLLHQNVRVVFSAPMQEADEIIRQFVEASDHPKDILVVSSDKAGITKYCRKIGADVMESGDFLDFLQRSGAGPKGKTQPPEEGEEKPDVRPEDVAYYLDKFTKRKK